MDRTSGGVLTAGPPDVLEGIGRDGRARLIGVGELYPTSFNPVRVGVRVIRHRGVPLHERRHRIIERASQFVRPGEPPSTSYNLRAHANGLRGAVSGFTVSGRLVELHEHAVVVRSERILNGRQIRLVTIGRKLHAEGVFRCYGRTGGSSLPVGAPIPLYMNRWNRRPSKFSPT